MTLSDLITDKEFVLVDFYADWCEPCKWAEPVMADVLSRFENPPPMIKVDIDKEHTLAKEFHVMSVPTFVLLKKGEEVWRMRGFDTAGKMHEAIASKLVGQ